MWAIVKGFISANFARLVEILAIIGAGTAAVTGIYRAGKKNEQVDELKQVSKEQEMAHGIENDNRLRPNGAASDELRDDWSR